MTVAEALTVEPVSETAKNANIMERAMLMSIEFGRFGNSRKAELGLVTVNAEKKLLRLSKKLLSSKEYDAISSHDRAIKKWLDGQSLPFPIRRGSFMIPDTFVDQVVAGLEVKAVERQALVEAFIAVYPSLVSEVRSELRDLYDAEDYPTPAEVSEDFTFTWHFLEFGVPDRLKKFKAEVYQSEKEKIQGEITTAKKLMGDVLALEASALVKRMVEVTAPTVEGAPKKVIKNALIDKVTAFLKNFNDRNIVDHAGLAKVVDQMKRLMSGVDAGMLRTADGIRQDIQKGFAEIDKALDVMVVTPGRKIRFAPTPSAEA